MVTAMSERQYRIDAASARWVDAMRVWMQDDASPFPQIARFIEGMSSDEATEVMEFALTCMVEGLPKPIDEPPDLELSPAGEKAMAAIRAQREGEA